MQKVSKHSWCGALVLVIAIALWGAAPLPVHALPFNPAVEYVDSGALIGAGLYTLGYQFSTSVPFNVDALAYWIYGNGNSHQVGLWDSLGNLLVSTTVLLDTDPIQGHFAYHAIPMYSLGPGTYTIGGEHLGDIFPAAATGVVTVPGFAWIQGVTATGSGLIYPTDTYNGGSGPIAILIPNFSIAVPEPSTLIFLASGLLLCYGWRRKRVA